MARQNSKEALAFDDKKFNSLQSKVVDHDTILKILKDGIPDTRKRECILKFFKIKPEDAEKNYAIVKDLAGLEMLELVETSRLC